MQQKQSNEINNPILYTSVLLVGIFFILYTILSQGKALLLDEFIMLITAKRPIVESLLQTQDYSAPFYQLLLRLFIWNNHPSPLVLRIPAAFAAALCLFISWQLVQKTLNTSLSLAFIILLGLNPFFIDWATMARPYTFYGLFFMCCMILACDIIDSYSDKKTLYFILSSILLGYTTFIGIPITILMVSLITILLPHRHNAIRFLKWNLLTLFCLFPVFFLLFRYIAEGLPALYGGWIRKPTFIYFITGTRFSDFFGDLYTGGIFFSFFIIALTIFAHNFYLYSKNKTDIKQNYYLIKDFNKQRTLWFLILIFILSLSYLINACSLYFPIYTDRYAFPVVILLLLCFILIIDNFPLVSRIAFLLIVCILYLPHIQQTFFDKRNSIIYAGLRVNNMLSDNKPVYLVNWKHGTDWTSPEYYGLKYYGFKVQECKFIDLNYGNSDGSIKDDAFLKESPHAAILVYGNMRNIFADFFNKRHIAFKRESISDYTLFYY